MPHLAYLSLGVVVLLALLWSTLFAAQYHKEIDTGSWPFIGMIASAVVFTLAAVTLDHQLGRYVDSVPLAFALVIAMVALCVAVGLAWFFFMRWAFSVFSRASRAWHELPDAQRSAR